MLLHSINLVFHHFPKESISMFITPQLGVDEQTLTITEFTFSIIN